MQDQAQDNTRGRSPNTGTTTGTGGVGSLNSIRIAGLKTVGEWNELKEKLIRENSQSLWEEAFNDYFLARLASRYLEPIKLLQKYGTLEGEGFSITAIHCSLIEFLQSTYEGKNYVHRGGAETAVQYSDSREIFVRFLRDNIPFKNSFTIAFKNSSNEDLAIDFYRNVRCGLLHEARTKGGWKILAKSQNGDLISIVSVTEKIIYRDNFHWGLLEFIEWYRKKLLSDCLTQEVSMPLEGIRQAFIRKVNSLCG